MISTNSKVGLSYLAIAPDNWLARLRGESIENTKQPIAISGWRKDLLTSCHRFATRAQLARFSDAQIRELEQLGLIISDAEILTYCAALESADHKQRITDLGLLTCASPKMLARSVRSWEAWAHRHERPLRITIVDDSSSAADSKAQSSMAQSLARSTGMDLRFVSTERRLAIAEEVAKQTELDPQLTRFAVDGRQAPRNGIGGNRNLLLLLLQGRCVMSADDDILAEFTAPQAAELDLWMTSSDARMELIPFDSPEQTQASVSLSKHENILDAHENFIGRAISNLVRELDGHCSLFDMSGDLAQAIAERPMAVGVTASGLAGDCGSDCQAFFTLLGTSAPARNYILNHGSELHSSREVLRKARFPIVSNANSLMTFLYAQDNRLALPPFFPVGRGEDQAWQALLHHCLPETLMAHLPIAAAHRPAQQRRYSTNDYLDPCQSFPANAFLVWIIGKFAASKPESKNCTAVGEYLSELARDSDRFSNNLQAAWLDYINHHSQLLRQSPGMAKDSPSWWRQRLIDIRDILDEKRKHIEYVPLQYVALSGTPAISAFRSDIGRYAELLKIWPAMRAAASGLSERLIEDVTWLRP